MWARAMGGEPLGSLPATQATTMALSLTPRDVAERLQVFYDTRNQYFDYDAISAAQTEYFAIAESQRAAFRQANPEMMRYWDWRRQFLYQNPALIDYLVEDPSTFLFPTAQAYEEAVATEPNFQWAEWYSYLDQICQIWFKTGTEARLCLPRRRRGYGNWQMASAYRTMHS